MRRVPPGLPQWSYFRVLYDFEAKGAAELDVAKDTYVMAIESTDIDEEGWLKVETVTDKRAGFVPRVYVVEVPAAEALASVGGDAPVGADTLPQGETSFASGSAAQHTDPEASQINKTLDDDSALRGGWNEAKAPAVAAADDSLVMDAAADAHRARSASGSQNGMAAVPQAQGQGQAFTQANVVTTTTTVHAVPPAGAGRGDVFSSVGFGGVEEAGAPQPASSNASPEHGLAGAAAEVARREPSSTAQSYTGSIVESFMKNEVYFRSLMKQRQETFLRLDACINATASEVSVCKSKNATLAKKIRELDNMIDEDRAKWRGRVEEEKKLLLSQTSGFGVGGSNTPVPPPPAY